jgi:hypothetical protein
MQPVTADLRPQQQRTWGGELGRLNQNGTVKKTV